MLTGNLIKQRRRDVTIFRSAAVLNIHAIKTRPDFATSLDSKLSGVACLHGSKLFAVSKFSLWGAGAKSCGFACEFAGNAWRKGESEKKKLQIQKYPDTCGRGLNMWHCCLGRFV